MSTKTYFILQIAALLFVFAQPIFGWSAIPRLVNYSAAWGIMLGLLDGAIIGLPFIVYVHFNP